MKHKLFTTLLVMLMSMTASNAFAHDAEINGIYYNFSGNEATVTFKGNTSYEYWDEYSGSIVIPETVNYDDHDYTVTSIGDYAFYGSTTVFYMQIQIPNTVTSIGKSAFGNCPRLTSVKIPNSVTTIGTQAFGGCSSLSSIEIPNSVTSISEETFVNCASLTTIKIPNSVTTIGNGAFRDCENLTSIEISSRVTKIGDYAFKGCSNLSTVIIPSSITTIGNNAFWNCENLTSIEIPNSVTIIDYNTFAGCTRLTSIEIPGSVTSIRSSAFSGCTRLSSIEIPSSVTSIGYDTFSGCTRLASVIVNWVTPISISSGVFTNRANATLYVPRGSKAAYEAADYWKEFKEIVEFTPTALIAMGSSGIMTYSNNSDLNFTSVSGLKAYIASGFNPATGDLTMTRVYEVPAGEGLILKGAADSYEVPYAETSAYYANLLVGVPTATTVNPTDGDYTNFILANDAVKGIGFYPLASEGEIGPNKAYLQLPTSILPAAARSLRMVFDDEEDLTGINALNDKGQLRNDKAVYDLQGRRVANPTRGLYIKGGKKIMVK
jgi:hypothetical protein